MDKKAQEELRRLADETIQTEVVAASEILATANSLLEQLLAEAYEAYLKRTVNLKGASGEFKVVTTRAD